MSKIASITARELGARTAASTGIHNYIASRRWATQSAFNKLRLFAHFELCARPCAEPTNRATRKARFAVFLAAHAGR